MRIADLGISDEDDSSSHTIENEPSPASSRPRPGRRDQTQMDRADEPHDGDTPRKRSSKKALFGNVAGRTSTDSPTKKRSQRQVSLSDSDPDDLSLPTRTMKSRPTMFSSGTISVRKDVEGGEDSSSQESEDIISATRKASKASKSSGTTEASRRARPIIIEDDEEDEEDAYVTSSAMHRDKPTAHLSDEDDDEPLATPLKRRRPRIFQDKESSSSDTDVSPLKRRRTAQESEESSDSDLPSPRQLSSRSKGKSAADTPQRYTRQKKEKRRHRSDREKALELAKRRRAGDKSELTPSDSSSAEDGEDSNLEHLSEFEDDDEGEEEEPIQKPKPKSKPRPARQDSSDPVDLEDEDDFIVEDDEEPLGVDISIPLEFTSQNHLKPREHFRHAIEWMVHKRLNPGFAAGDELYRRAFQVLDSKPTTLAASKYGSSVWTADFYRALNARPGFAARKIASDEAFVRQGGQHKCEVCNRRNHPSTYAIRFEGKAYYKDSLDEVEQDDDEDDEDGDESDDGNSGGGGGVAQRGDRAPSVDARGMALPPEAREWFSGQFCFRKAQTAHMLVHWKHELYVWVQDALEREGELAARKLVRRDRMGAKERRAYADAVADQWWAGGKGGEVDSLWRDYEAQIRTAEEAFEGGRWGK